MAGINRSKSTKIKIVNEQITGAGIKGKGYWIRAYRNRDVMGTSVSGVCSKFVY